MVNRLLFIFLVIFAVSCVEEIPVDQLEQETFGDTKLVNEPAPNPNPVTVDTTKPIILSSAPSGTQPETTSSVILNILVDEPSECRYDFSSKAFLDMSYTLTTNDKRSHFKQVSVMNDQSYSYQVRCRDLSSNHNESELKEIKFYVDKKGAVDNINPSILSISPSGELEAGKTSVSLQVVLSEKGICKYSNDPLKTFLTMDLLNSQDGVNHQLAINNLVSEQNYSYSVICQDLAGNSSSKGQTSFKIKKEAPLDLNIAARGILDRNCLSCHNSSLKRANLDLSNDSVLFDKIEKFIVKGVPSESRIYLSLASNTQGVSQMPPGGQLSESERFIIRDWILAMPKDVVEPDAIACNEEEDLNSALTRMLLNPEIGRSFDVLLGGSKYMPDLSDLPGKIGNKFGMTKDGSLQTLSNRDVKTIFDSFEKSIDLFIADRSHGVFSCANLQNTALNQCLDKEMVPMIYRAWRRPVTSAQKQEFYTIFNGKSFNDGLKISLSAVFLDPKFLFISYDNNVIPRKLNSFEIAERLAFLIWGRVPPINLLDYAASNDLTDKAKLKVAMSMLFDFDGGTNPTDTRRQFAWSFYLDLQNQWLEMDHLSARTVPNGVSFNKGEVEWATMFYIEEMFRKNKTIKDLYESNFVVVTPSIDHLYGVSFNQAVEAEYDIYHTQGHTFRKMMMPKNKRKGLFTQAGILAVNSGRKDDVSPTERGLWHASKILCDTPDAVPSNIPLDDEILANPNLSLKEKFAEHAKGPTCAGCHKIMDPIGFGLHGYDVVGRERDQDGAGFEIDPSGTLEGQFFNTTAEMIKIISESKKAELCTISHLATFSVGRALDAKKSCTAQKILKDVKNQGGGLRNIIEEILTSDLFIMRRK